jgi:hypothetical protein
MVRRMLAPGTVLRLIRTAIGPSKSHLQRGDPSLTIEGSEPLRSVEARG